MNSNLSQTQILNTQKNTFKTYFIHVKKSSVNDFDDLNTIKNLLDDKLQLSDELIQFNDLKFINKIDLENKSYKTIGKYLKSNKESCCSECNKSIEKQSIFKELNCGHRFHVKCIDPKLKNDMYKKCVKCCSENITCLL